MIEKKEVTNMAFKEVSSLNADKTIAIGGFNKKERKDNPTSAQGYYLGTKTVPSSLSASGTAEIHFLQTPQGNLGIWGKTDLNRKMAGVTSGNLIRITFTGTQASKKGSDMYVYKVEVDADDSIEVAPTASSLETQTYNDNPNAEFDGEDEEYEAPKKANTPDAARQAKVKELLNKGRSKVA